MCSFISDKDFVIIGTILHILNLRYIIAGSMASYISSEFNIVCMSHVI